MRSLTSKLIIAFLITSLLSIGIIALLARFSTSREFGRFLSDQYRTDLINQLTSYYTQNGSWKGVEKGFIRPGHDHGPGGDGNPPPFFTIADADGNIFVAGFGHQLGDVIGKEELGEGTLIVVDGQTVGILLIANSSPETNPMQAEFFHRLDSSLFFTVIGTTIIALIVGTFLSRNITRPVRELTAATRQMANGNLRQEVPVRSKDELGELASSFNKMSDDLVRSFNLRKQMTADIAHELRTPLSLIIGHAEAVHDGVLTPSLENFEIIREEAERLEKLVNDLRTLSLADAGELSVDFQPVDIRQLLKDIHAHYLYQFNQKRIEFDLEAGSDVLMVNLDPGRFSQVITNILENALRYTSEGGRVSVTTSRQMDIVQISIQDSGDGVTEGEAAHLFDRFYRADEARNRDEGGSGLGLAIAKSIVEMHKGKIWAESEKGKGLKLIIELPLLKST